MNTLTVAAIRCSLLFLVSAAAYAGSAQWDLNPISGDWNTAANWTPMTVPNGPADIATFDLSNTTNVSISANTEVNSIIFTQGNSAYAITANPNLTLTLSGTGIIGSAEFVTAVDAFGNAGTIVFSNTATAGNSGFTTGNPFGGGVIVFKDASTADHSGFDSSEGGEVEFFNTSSAGNAGFSLGFFGSALFADSSTAGNANIVNYSGLLSFSGNSTAGDANVFQIGPAVLVFNDGSTAGNANIVTGDETCSVEFSDTSTAGSATIGGYAYISFGESSQGGTARIELWALDCCGGGILDISRHYAPGVTIGSIADGFNFIPNGEYAFLGANNLTVGSNNLSTTFSGVIEDNGFSGSLTKIGTGTLDLMGENTYTGPTNINGGVLQVDGSISSNTFVNREGVLAGSGTVNGNVTNNNFATVSPGGALGVPGTLTVSSNYLQTQRATLVIQIAGANAGQFSVLNVSGNANLNGFLDPVLLNGFVPAIGQSFTFMNYASHTGFFPRIQNLVFDHGRKRWVVAYNPTGAVLTVVGNGPSSRPQ